MFYKKSRKIMYLPLIIIALIISFLCGEKYRNITISNKKIMVQNINYNDTLIVKGNNYSIYYSIINALFLNRTSMHFNVTVQKNSNVAAIKVVAKDQYNNILKIETIASADSNFLGYEVQLDTTITKKISIYVYPLTKDMLADLNNNALNINTIPFKTSNLDVALLKQQQIKDLLN